MKNTLYQLHITPYRPRYGGHENGSGNTDDEKESEDGKGWWTGSGVKDIYDGNDYATIGDNIRINSKIYLIQTLARILKHLFCPDTRSRN